MRQCSPTRLALHRYAIDPASGETVTYTYDSLNRAIAAQATNNSWGNAYSYAKVSARVRSGSNRGSTFEW